MLVLQYAFLLVCLFVFFVLAVIVFKVLIMRTQICFFEILQMIRGGVEDTRLEAKDTKKIRGQGQPFRGQTLSRPRTGMLEAKAKDQEHKRKCSPKKKKVFTKIFQAISKNEKKRSSQKFFKRSPQKTF